MRAPFLRPAADIRPRALTVTVRTRPAKARNAPLLLDAWSPATEAFLDTMDWAGTSPPKAPASPEARNLKLQQARWGNKQKLQSSFVADD
ncbi:hypothetical protein MKZ38_008030 [Zalerion maritima]|uniref:Uncharacterized protein n=1 Tax=Zalerion maritima TaxID=339359 RepID=A0AAD5RH61_9PEZI|nr:hypothetical protein MKZ38_008030 [Zalerion maritima]